jgi:hypothetical protein
MKFLWKNLKFDSKILKISRFRFADRSDVISNENIKNRIKKKWDDRSGNKTKSMFFQDRSDFGKVRLCDYQGLE